MFEFTDLTQQVGEIILAGMEAGPEVDELDLEDIPVRHRSLSLKPT